MNRPAVDGVIGAIRDCALIMFENATYIQRELPSIEMSTALKSETAEACELLVGTKYDVISELFEIEELLESKPDWGLLSSRIDRLITWLSSNLPRLHQLVMALREDSQKNLRHTLSLVLVQESAVNILNAFNSAKAKVDALASEKE